MRGRIVLVVEEATHSHLMPKAGIALFDFQDRGAERASRQLAYWCLRNSVCRISIEVDSITGTKNFSARLDPLNIETLSLEHWTGPLNS
jgi:hypothetical protein